MAPEDDSAVRMEVETRDDATVVRPRGRITEVEAHDLTRQLIEQIDGGARKIVADLAHVPYLSSSGLGAFMAAQKAGRNKGVVILLASPVDDVRAVFVATKLDRLFPIHATVEEALAAL